MSPVLYIISIFIISKVIISIVVMSLVQAEKLALTNDLAYLVGE